MNPQTPSQTTLDGIPERVVTFLGAISRNEAIYATLSVHGYTQAEHDMGIELLRKYTALPNGAIQAALDNKARAAIAALDQWDEPFFRMASAALRYRHPAQWGFVFNNLNANTGYGAVTGITTFLDRLDALQSGDAREETREADAAALATLAARGIDAEERHRLRALIAEANTVPTLPDAEVQARRTAEQEARHKAQLDLYAWHNDWSSTARSFITRRDHLISLGMASRRRSETSQDEA